MNDQNNISLYLKKLKKLHFLKCSFFYLITWVKYTHAYCKQGKHLYLVLKPKMHVYRFFIYFGPAVFCGIIFSL
jgi:hypothetical protein